ncbi:adenylate kinase family protein [Candidatus Phytoplasma pini]|uniref:Adenylate kinase n=1 Tax=Candidatus Phytoplasma pini TaxID=267362 RepID=A0A559KJW8_9MOLU|nr:nucleoside monophosphate kinase [Candidatus Phytoplasma pini]TVY12409.1 adenylate kinase [Candidatus Phytoplasma pini]
MNLILIGPPATGKGTQSSILSKYFKIPHISIGDIFRKNLENKTPLGKIICDFIDKGLLVPNEITNKMISQYLSQIDISNGFILDGYPRNLSQSFFLSQEFENKKIILTKVIYFNSKIEFLKKRILGRIICPQCHEIYHKETKPPFKNNFCDNDGVLLIQRKDDNIETFMKRLSIYEKETFPLVEYYRKINKLLEIKVDEYNTKTSIQFITNLILKVLR